MMAFFRQFQLLLWKNGLTVIRQPVWSVTLIAWPLIIFIILAVTRHQFPPIVRETCYVAPRNLPSTGLFPFLQTLMCNTDSSCNNKSHLVEPTTSKPRNARSLKDSSPLESLSQVGDLLNLLPSNISNEEAELFKVLDILGSPYEGSPENAALRTFFNITGLENQEPENLLKRAFCTVALPMLNQTSPDIFTYGVLMFCMTNSTVLEVSLYTLDQILTELMLTQPEELMKVAGGAVTLFDQLQNDPLLWDSLLDLPQLFSGDGVDQWLSNTEGLLRNLQSVVTVIQNNIPETNGSLSKVHSVLAGGIDVMNYVTHWPGKNVTIPLREIVTNDSVGTVMKYLVEDVLDYRIPLDKAVGLMLDKGVVRSHLCDNSSNIFWSAAACSSGIVDKVLQAISPEKVAKQVFLVWSHDVAKHDVRFAKGLLHSLTGDSSSGAQDGSNITRVRRSTETPPQNAEEELFLNIGQGVMEFVQLVPEVDMVVQSILQTGFQSITLATVTVDTVEEILSNVLKDANQLQMAYHVLLTNESETSAWLGRVFDSVMEVAMKMMSPGNVNCEDLLAPLEWLLSSNSIKNEVWKAMICPSNNSLTQALLSDWMPLIQKAQDLYSIPTGRADFNVTLSTILSEWHRLYRNSTELSELLYSASEEMGEEYWKNWMPDNNTQINTGTLQKSFVWFLISLGERIENSDLWPTVKDYFYMAYWILNYSPDVTTQPANCSFNMNSSALHCDADLSWPQFVQTVTQALMSPSDALVNWLKGSVNLLQHVYGDIYQHLAASYVKQEITGGDALSDYLINLMNNLNDFLSMISRVPNQNITNPDEMIPHIGNLLESVGLSPLVPLLSNEHPLDASEILDVASKLGRLNQDVFTFDETDTNVSQLEERIKEFLSLEFNLTLSLPQIMGHTLLTYSQYLDPAEVNRLIKAIQPFDNQTSAGFVEAVISAVELLKTLTDSPNGDPTNIILGYIHQIQEFLVSLCRLQKIEPVVLPSGQNTTAQVTDLDLILMEFLNLFTPESLQNLSQVAPDVAQDIVIQKFVAFLPKEVQSDATHFLQDFTALQSHVTECTAGEGCLAEISEIFTFLDQILDLMLTANGNVTIEIAPTSSIPGGGEYEDNAATFFSLLLPPNDTAHLETFKQTLEFIKLVMNTPNITVSAVQNALTQSNLTIEDLNATAALAEAANIEKLMANIKALTSAEKCFEPQNDMMETTQCVVGLINVFSIFLTQVPSLYNNTTILSLIPVIVNKTINDFTHVNFDSNPNMALVDSLSLTLANIKMSLEQSQMNTSEIMNEIKVVEGLIQLIANMQPINTTQMDPVHVQRVYLELVEWYLKRLENISSDSAISVLLHPIFSITQMQVALQLSQTDFSLFVSDKVQMLINSLQGSVNGTDLNKIGQTTTEILRHLLDLINFNLESWSNIEGSEEQFNTTILQSTELQIKQYLSLIEKWMKEPSVPVLLSSMLQWENSTMATPVTDLNQLQQTMADFLSEDQRAYLSIISNITDFLNKAVMVAEQHGLQDEGFVAAIIEAVESAMQIPSMTNISLPLPEQQDFLEIVQETLNLILHPNTSFDLSIVILRNAEKIIQQAVPEMVSEYLLGALRFVTAYFESIYEANGQDTLNQIIFNELKTLESLLSQNSTAQPYVSALINITQLILESGQDNMSLWEGFENASADNLQQIVHQLGKLVTRFWPLVAEGIGSRETAPSLEAFTALAPLLENVLTGKADQDTWNKLEQMLETLLSALEGTELWNNLTSAIPQFEKVVETLVKNMQEENVVIQSLQNSILDLMTEAVQSSNSTDLNVSEVLEKMQLAIESTVQAVQQANGTLECSEILKVWEPVIEAAELSPDTIALWCNTSLQPILEAYASIQNDHSQMNMSMIMGPTSVSDTAARIVEAVQSLYQVNIDRALVVNQFIMIFYDQLSMLAGQSLSPEAQLYWLKQLQDTQLQYSLSSIKMLSDELLDVDPALQPYTEALVNALSHILDNYDFLQQSEPPKELLEEAAMIFLSSANITSHDVFSILERNSSASLNDLITEIIGLVINMKAFGDEPMIYQALEQYLASNGTSLITQKVAEMSLWLASTEASGLDLLSEALSKSYDILRPILSALSRMSMDMQDTIALLEDVAGNITMFRQLLSNSSPLGVMDQHPSDSEMTAGYQTPLVRRRRDVSLTMTRNPVEDFIDLFYIDYPAMFRAMAVPPTTPEIVETAHVFFANPNLNVVMKGASSNMQWGWNASREETIDSALEAFSLLTHPDVFEMSSMDLLKNMTEMLPDALPYSSAIKRVTRVLANESQANLMLMQEIIQSVRQLLHISPTDPQFKGNLDNLTSQVCTLERTESADLLMQSLNVEPGQLCRTFLPALQILAEALVTNTTAMADIINQAVVGDPRSYSVNTDWTAVLSQILGFNISSLSSLNVNASSPEVTFGEMLRNKTAFVMDVQQRMGLNPAALHLLTNTTLPKDNLVILSWLLDLRYCNSTPPANMTETDLMRLTTLCSLSPEQWYKLSVLTTRHVNTEKVMYKMVLSEDIQSAVGVMLQMAKAVTNMVDKMSPAVNKLQGYLKGIESFKMSAKNKLSDMAKGQRASMPSQASFVMLSRALCSNGIIALFGISKLPTILESHPSFSNNPQREEMIERFKLPRNATPFCMNMYLDMVNTTGGAIAWAFLKPMLMGQILYTPDTPTTRAIIERANTTLQDFANVRKFSEDWIKSTTHLFSSAQKLEKTLPMLQNSLGNPFVKHFIEMQTGINIGRLEKTLSNFSNMTMMLDNNKDVLNQITTLSTLMVDISSCIMFDRYRGFDSADELNSAAQALAKDRNLYASVIFKLPKDADSSRNKRDAVSSTSSLPPQVSYTIRMHMDNVMRTDRVRNPYFVKDTHISARNTMRYNRGFIYLQESIDRAIIETQTGQRVTDTAVQLQPFPYPCYQRDEYLEAISFVFPLMLMIAWVLFIADFVKKLVHERELRLHEYMKMMGVNTLSHFFAWFVECATYLLTTIIIMTLVLKYGKILPNSDGFLIFLYLCDYGLSIIAFSYLVSAFFDKTYIAGLSGSLLYILCFFPFIIVSALEGSLTFFQKSALGLFSPTCFSYASQYASRYEAQGEGMQWSNSYTSPLAGDTASFGWLCWLMLIDSILYFIIGAYIRTVFPGQYGIAAPWYFPFKPSFWADLCCIQSKNNAAKGRLFTNIMQNNQPAFNNDKGKGKSALSTKAGEDFSDLPVGVALHRLTKTYGDQVAIENLNVSFYEGHVTSLLGHNGAGKTTTMSLLTGLYAPSSGSIEVYGKDMQTNIDRVRKELGVCMQYDVLFDHMTTKEHLLLYGQIKAPHWSHRELREQVRTILEDTGMYAHRHKLVGTLSGGMKRKLSISIAFIGGSRLVVLDEPTTGVDPCSRRSIWDIVIQHKKNRTIIMSTHHLDEAEVLSDRIAFLERGGLKCCGSPFYLKDKLGQGYKLTLTKKMQNTEGERVDSAELKAFVQAHVPQARLKEAQGNDLVYSLPPFNSSNASSYRSLLTALDSNLNALQLGGYGISDTTLEEVFLQLTQGHRELGPEDGLMSISETVSDTISVDSFSSDGSESGNKIKLSSPSTVTGMALAWQQISAILIKRFHHSRRDWKGLISQILLPVLFVVCAMGLGSIRNDVQHYPELQLSPALYNIGASYSFFSSQNPNSSRLADAMTSFPGMDTACFDKPDNPICTRNTNQWSSRGNSSKGFSVCKCTRREQICDKDNYQPPHKKIPSSQIVYNLSGINVENYLVATANDFIRNRYGGFDFGMPLPADLKMDITAVPGNRTLSKVWFNPEGHHTMPAYLNSLNNLILRSNLPADKDPRKYAISVYSQPYFGRADDEDTIVQGLLHVLVAMCVLTGFSITTASFAIYEVTEHQTGSKRLQHIAGISEPLYWTVNFLYDMIIYLIPVAATIAVIAAFQIPAFTERQNLGAITLLLFLFGFSTFPWMYLLAGVFKDAEMAFISYVCINLFISVNTILSTSILYFLGQISMHNPEAIQKIFHRLSNAFLIFPQFSFGNGLMELARSDIEVQILSGYGIDAYKNPFSTDALGWMFFSSLIQGLVFFVLRLLVNRSLIRKVRRLICHSKTVPQVARDEDEDEDEDVAAEHLRVSSGAANSDILQVNGLSKVYKHFTKKVHAVKKLSVGIPAGECFGLLGVNGAGKTTTFKMLTGDISPTDGTAQIRDWDGRLVDIMECRKQGINIGYCPQVDALDNLLTGEEHLYFYARIRGISKRETDRVVNYLLKRLQLNYHRNIITDGYSCGTRRKLSTALALIGHPQILLLDEPSSGMDPRTKRHLWKIISEEVKGKCAVVLTSHSMEECEALCSRLAIMVKGQFRCLGSLQHIKNRFGSGFTVKMYLAEASCDVEKITSFMQRRFPSTCLKDQHSTVVEYHVLFAPGGLADIFDQLESNKNALQIKHFSVSQTTLDEVFINFAMGKIGMETIPIDSDDESDSLDSIKEVQT